jgi:hypothetical protein
MKHKRVYLVTVAVVWFARYALMMALAVLAKSYYLHDNIALCFAFAVFAVWHALRLLVQTPELLESISELLNER